MEVLSVKLVRNKRKRTLSQDFQTCRGCKQRSYPRGKNGTQDRNAQRETREIHRPDDQWECCTCSNVEKPQLPQPAHTDDTQAETTLEVEKQRPKYFICSKTSLQAIEAIDEKDSLGDSNLESDLMTYYTDSDSGKTLKSIFEDPDITKFFWDVRNDADALWAHYRVGLAGVIDIQLLENASREDGKTYIRGLDKSVQYDLKLGFMELNRWLRTKKDVKDLMPNNVFSARPLEAKTIQYCVNDIIYLPALYALYLKRMKGDWLTKAMNESARRVVEAHGVGYEPQSESKKLGPWGAGGRKQRVTMDQMLAMVDEDMMGFYDDVSDNDDWGGMNAHDGAQDSEAFYSCWDKN